MKQAARRDRDSPGGARPRVVIVGAGFAGREAIKVLADTEVDVLVVDQHNYHTFWPLLYQVAIAGLEAGQVAHPVRALVQRYPNVRFRLAEVLDLDEHARRLYTDDGPVDYDYLILATGSRPNFFGLDSVERVAYTLGGVDQAVALRNHILSCFEEAVHEPSAARRRALLTFVIVGAGPTGVELAGALAELQRFTLRQDFPDLDFDEVRILVIEMLDTVLPPFDEPLQAYTRRRLAELGVEVMLGTAVESATCDTVFLKGGGTIPAHTIIWSAGILPRLSGILPFQQARGGRVLARATLQVAGREEVFVAGDLAYVEGRDGKAHPQLAPVAMQQGESAARNVLRLVRAEEPAPFEYHDRGTMATIGRSAAVAQVFGRQLTGFVAWVLWLVVHIIYLMGFRNRLIVLINWAYSYFAYEPGVRLIVGLRRECDPGLAMAGAPDVELQIVDDGELLGNEDVVQRRRPVDQEKQSNRLSHDCVKGESRMNYSQFMGQVQNRARMATQEEAVRATRATLQTLGQRLGGGEPNDIATQLPNEIGRYLKISGAQESVRFGLDEFFNRARAHMGGGTDLPHAVFYARVVMSVLKEAISPGEWRDMQAQLPDEYDTLLETGYTGEMEEADDDQ